MAENATLFFTYNQAQSLLKSSHLFLSPSSSDTLSMTGLVAAGAISGAFTSYVLTPIELIKCKLQVQNVGLHPTTYTTSKRPPLPALAALHTSAKPTNPGPLQLIQQVYRTQGIRGFWRGQMGTFLRETGGNAAWFGTYEYISSLLKRDNEICTRDRMVSGAFAGMAYNFVLFPADSIKSRMQTEIVSDLGVQRGFLEVGSEMWRYGGVRVFYRGCLITVLRAAPASAVIFSVYEELKRIAQ
jgi:ornithine carrier protein